MGRRVFRFIGVTMKKGLDAASYQAPISAAG
jgi:hypothetical protein